MREWVGGGEKTGEWGVAERGGSVILTFVKKEGNKNQKPTHLDAI